MFEIVEASGQQAVIKVIGSAAGVVTPSST